jgi:hypothetical protein
MATQENPNDKPDFTAADGSKYKIGKLTYPMDLIGNYSEYGESMILFNINVLESSKLGKSKQEKFVKDFTPSQRSQLAAADYSNTRVGGAYIAASAALGTAGGQIAGDGLLGTVLSGAAAAATFNEIKGSSGKFTRPVKRLQTAIALHMPNQLQVRYGMTWQDKDMLTETAVVESLTPGAVMTAGAGGLIAAATGNSVAKGAATGYAAANIVGKPGMTSALALANLPGGDFLSAGTGEAANPKKEQTFKGVEFRTFNINYEFYPRSAEEARNVLNIIYQFKYHMHPEFKEDTSFLFIYPSEFDIFYYKGKGLNKAIHKHTSCILSDLTINYTPNGQYTTFKDGTPTQINVQMQFRELGILTKESIEKGL